jgi:hypothetical protein
MSLWLSLLLMWALLGALPAAAYEVDKAEDRFVWGDVDDDDAPDGRCVYVSDWDGNRVYVYDAFTFERVTEFDDVTTPTGIFNSSRRFETLGH